MSLLNISTAVFSKRRFLKYFYSVQFLSKKEHLNTPTLVRMKISTLDPNGNMKNYLSTNVAFLAKDFNRVLCAYTSFLH